MSLLGPLFRPRNEASITTSKELAEHLSGGVATVGGAVVSPERALRHGTVWACVRLLSESVAQLPYLVYRRTDQGRQRVTDHPLAKLLKAPNARLTGFEWVELLMIHLLLRGNHYALRITSGTRTTELLPLQPQWVSVETGREPSPTVTYKVSLPDGGQLTVPPSRMLHLRGLSLDGLTGLNPIALHRETVASGLQMQEFNNRLFAQGATPVGVLEHPGLLSKAALARLREDFDQRYSGLSNARKTMILEEGMKFTKTGLSPEDIQFLAQRQWAVTEIAGIYRVPPHMVGDLSRATFSNIEQQSLDFVKHSLQPWLTRIESRVNATLVGPGEQDTIFTEFLVEGLLRGDFKTRTEGYNRAIIGGWMNRNEVRQRENMNPVEGLDEFLTPTAVAQPSSGGRRSTDPTDREEPDEA